MAVSDYEFFVDQILEEVGIRKSREEMEKRIYCGVDLNVDYATLLKAEKDPEKFEQLMAKRYFKIGCFAREKFFNEGMIVVDCNNKGWKIKKIDGSLIEEMRLHLIDDKKYEKVVDAIDVVDFSAVELDSEFSALKYAIHAAAGLQYDLPKIRRNGWFDVVEQVKQMEQEGDRCLN